MPLILKRLPNSSSYLQASVLQSVTPGILGHGTRTDLSKISNWKEEEAGWGGIGGGAGETNLIKKAGLKKLGHSGM